MKHLRDFKFLYCSKLTIIFSCTFLCMLTNIAYANITIRPISDFVNAQGSITTGVAVPVRGGSLKIPESYIWGTNSDDWFRLDYAGREDKALIQVGGPNVGTSYPLSFITEEPKAGGGVEDTVYLNTVNAISYVVNVGNPPAHCTFEGASAYVLCPAVFGYTLPEIANGVGQPTLGVSSMVIKFVNISAGAPIPDMVNLSFTPGQIPYLETWTIKAAAVGPLRSGFDGVPNGTPGVATLDVTIDTSKNEDNEIVTILK